MKGRYRNIYAYHDRMVWFATLMGRISTEFWTEKGCDNKTVVRFKWNLKPLEDAFSGTFNRKNCLAI